MIPCEREGILSRQKLNDIAKEVFRKAIHLCSALLPLFLSLSYRLVLSLLVFAVIFYTICEFLRLNGKNVPLVSTITATAARKRDENKFVLGPVTLCTGILICALLYPPLPASIGIYALAFGDGLASLSGKLWGKVQIPFAQGKTAEGSLTCFLAIFISSFLAGKNTALSLLLATFGMLIEVLPLKDFDNVFIPILIGGVATLFL